MKGDHFLIKKQILYIFSDLKMCRRSAQLTDICHMSRNGKIKFKKTSLFIIYFSIWHTFNNLFSTGIVDHLLGCVRRKNSIKHVRFTLSKSRWISKIYSETTHRKPDLNQERAFVLDRVQPEFKATHLT